MKKLVANKNGAIKALSIVIIVPALAVILIVFFIWLRTSAVERSEAIIKGELSSIYAREQVLAFLEEPAQNPKWRTLASQSTSALEAMLNEFYRQPNPGLIKAKASCERQDKIIDCDVFLTLNIPLSELGLLNPLDPLFIYRGMAELLREKFVEEAVPIPSQDGVLVFKLKGERTL